VQGELEQALAKISGRPVAVLSAGRTDKGVHASGQVVTFHLPEWRHDGAALVRAVNHSMHSVPLHPLPPHLTCFARNYFAISGGRVPYGL
jgi:tRNA U38,U39,U40 pseudouridine synthase TruA